VSHEGRPTISTHVLDTATGQPAVGVWVLLWRADPDAGADPVGDAVTDQDGRVRDLLAGRALEAGTYRLEFDLGTGFFRSLTVVLEIDDPGRSYHVPLLRSPYGLTTYRGS
jgi:5-hydroxyisourate hydrolase